jgi:hypothetical protein
MRVIITILAILLAPSLLFAGFELRQSRLMVPVNIEEMAQADDFNDIESDKAEREVKAEQKSLSKLKAVALSLLLPGAGQYYAGAKGRAEVFLGMEAAIWASALAFHTYGNWKKDDYIRYAEQHAGIDPSGKDDDFFKNLTFYINREEYNEDGRIINPTAPIYPITQSYYWQWEDTDSRTAYRNLRNASKSAFRKATFMIGVAVFNRIVSGIDSFRIVQKMTKKVEDDEEFSSAERGLKFKFKANPFGSNPNITFNIIRQF